MMRPKGGKRQPRYFRLKDAGAEKLCMYLERKTPREDVERDTLTRADWIRDAAIQTEDEIVELITDINNRLARR